MTLYHLERIFKDLIVSFETRFNELSHYKFMQVEKVEKKKNTRKLTFVSSSCLFFTLYSSE